MYNSRRNFIKKAVTSGTAVIAAPALFGIANASKQNTISDPTSQFKLKYAPSIGMFRQHAGTDPIDHIKFCHDMGFRAVFDNGLMNRPVEEQDKIIKEVKRLGMDFGPFVVIPSSLAPSSFVHNRQDVRDMLVNKLKEGVEVYKRTGVKWGLVSLGNFDLRLHRDYQTANVIDNLRYCCDVVEPVGLILVLEPLNTLINHPGRFLTGIPQAYAICRAVNSPSCKIVNDFYHQQITEGNLIPNLEIAWNEIAAFHIGDSPGRNEPTTGEINYKNIFKYIYDRKYDGVICMEHGISNRKSMEGEARVIQAYRECDSFDV